MKQPFEALCFLTLLHGRVTLDTVEHRDSSRWILELESNEPSGRRMWKSAEGEPLEVLIERVYEELSATLKAHELTELEDRRRDFA